MLARARWLRLRNADAAVLRCLAQDGGATLASIARLGVKRWAWRVGAAHGETTTRRRAMRRRGKRYNREQRYDRRTLLHSC